MIELLIVIALLFVGWVILSAVVSFAIGIVGFVITALIWMFTGYVAGWFIRGKGYGPLYDALLGMAGGVVGSIILGAVGLNVGGVFGMIMSGILGAIILVYAVRFLRGDSEFAS